MIDEEDTTATPRAPTWAPGRWADGQGLLRVGLDGAWTLADFSAFLARLQAGYECASALLFLADGPGPWPGAPDGDARSSVRMFALQLASPLKSAQRRVPVAGLAALIGSLNPVKVLADFISNWRSENTRREWLRHQYQLELLNRIPQPFRGGVAATLLAQTIAATTEIARDRRVGEIDISQYL